jgi:hypothetical protein
MHDAKDDSDGRWARRVRRGDWVVHGEGGECYVVDDGFFQRTFSPDPGAEAHLAGEGRHYGC